MQDDNKLDKTGVYESIEDKTGLYEEDVNPLPLDIHGINIGDIISLKGLKYKIIGIISSGTGEAIIYKVVKEGENKPLVLKLYRYFDNIKHEPNRETLSRILKIDDPDILKLYDFGVGKDKYQGRYCFEISAFAEGEDLFQVTNFRGKYTPEFVEKCLIPEIFNGIKKLHDNKIYHCDLKPQNIFYLNQEQTDIVIGDYGSAKAYDIDIEIEVRKTSIAKGTDVYMAPEQAKKIITDANDYYSFGMILLHIVYPEAISKSNDLTKVDKNLYEILINRQFSSLPLGIYKEKEEMLRLNRLIEGLTLFNPQNRWGRKEIEKWLNPKTEIDNLVVNYQSFGGVIEPIKVSNGRSIHSIKELLHFLETDKNAVTELTEEKVDYEEFQKWIQKQDGYGKDERVEFTRMVSFYQVIDSKIESTVKSLYKINYTREFMLRFFHNLRPISINGQTFVPFSNDILQTKEIARLIAYLDDNLREDGGIELAKYGLFCLDLYLRQVRKLVSDTPESVSTVNNKLCVFYNQFGGEADGSIFKSELPNLAKNQSINSYINLFYEENPTRGFKVNNQLYLQTIEDLTLYLADNPEEYDEAFMKTERKEFLNRNNLEGLADLSYKDFVFEVFKDKVDATIEIVSLTFDHKRNYEVLYKQYSSLNNFLKTKNIQKDFTNRSEIDERYTHQRKWWGSFLSEYDNFWSTVKQKHRIFKITKQNEESIKSKFTKDVWGRYLSLHAGQTVGFVLFLLSLYFIHGIASHKILISDGGEVTFVNWLAGEEKIKYEVQQKQEGVQKFINDNNIIVETIGFLNYSKSKGKDYKYKKDNLTYSLKPHKSDCIEATIFLTYNAIKGERKTFSLHYQLFNSKNEMVSENSNYNNYFDMDWSRSCHNFTICIPWKKGTYRFLADMDGVSLGERTFTIK